VKGFKDWFSERYGFWPWLMSDPPPTAFERLADGFAEYVDEVTSELRRTPRPAGRITGDGQVLGYEEGE